MHSTGFGALLSRSLALANTEMPWLRAVQVQPDGLLAGLVDLIKQVDSEDLIEGGVVMLAQLPGLLVAFIGRESHPAIDSRSLAEAVAQGF